MIAFSHYINTPNIGDLMCAPYHYFPFEDAKIFDLGDEIPACEAVIYGGGAIEPKLRTERIQDRVDARLKIGWGIGTSRRGKKDHGPLVSDLDLCGVREFGREKGVRNAFYVPCVSAMSSAFDKEYKIKQDIVFYTHGVFHLPDSGPAPRANNRAATLEEAIAFLGSGETVVTNSFHGAYWGALLGRKVVCIPFSSKFYGYKYPPSYCLDQNYIQAAKLARSYPEALEDARKHNIAFNERVRNAIEAGPKRVYSADQNVSKRANPYVGITERSHWKRAIVGRSETETTDWYHKKFDISAMRISTAGSCFAQHIGNRLKNAGYKYVDVEPGPETMERSLQAEFGYGLYSARYGNIYTTRQLKQLFDRAYGDFQPKERFWSQKQGFVDPFRPTIEPEPFATKDDVRAERGYHMKRVRRMVETTDLFVFTLGLTETWASKIDGAVFPIAPGVSGGHFSNSRHAFLNLSYEDVVSDLQAVIDRLRGVNQNMHFLLTVSPVPLMATATADHIAVATVHSKSILRAAAGHFVNKYDFVDYFPSYEIINSHVSNSFFYEADKRNVKSEGVDFVMSQFFDQHASPKIIQKKNKRVLDKLVCDEELLMSFGVSK